MTCQRVSAALLQSPSKKVWFSPPFWSPPVSCQLRMKVMFESCLSALCFAWGLQRTSHFLRLCVQVSTTRCCTVRSTTRRLAARQATLLTRWDGVCGERERQAEWKWCVPARKRWMWLHCAGNIMALGEIKCWLNAVWWRHTELHTLSVWPWSLSSWLMTTWALASFFFHCCTLFV